MKSYGWGVCKRCTLLKSQNTRYYSKGRDVKSRRVADADTVLRHVFELPRQKARFGGIYDRGTRLIDWPSSSSGARANSCDQILSN